MENAFVNENQPSMDEYLNGMKEKTEELLRKFFVGKTFQDEPWAEEHFDVTMQVVVDVTVTNTDVTNFSVNTSIYEHLLFMNVQDNQGNTVADVIYEVTYEGEEENPTGYAVDDVQVAFKLGAFVAPKLEEEADEADVLPF